MDLLAAPVTLEYEPASQAMHVSGPVATGVDEYLPAAHMVHVSEASTAKEPVGHVSASTLSEVYVMDVTDTNPSTGSDRLDPILAKSTLDDTPGILNVARVYCWHWDGLHTDSSTTSMTRLALSMTVPLSSSILFFP